MRTWAGRAEGAFGLRASLLLVLAVLTGLVAMHGLGPAPLAVAAHAPAHGASGDSGSGHDTPTVVDVSAEPCACVRAGDPQDGPGGHAEHADATCAAPGTSGPPVLPEPAVAPGSATTAAAGPYGVLTGATACGRAPPSLSELQLLRV
ncbi:DUF6153 family protein [Streptomyces sp. NPDC090054]|uniref:DUF6153 family protein n=1 Tax=Streptomyces sp. NPDC090054 TaxID=3365933 RepID=UPI003827327D